MSEKARLILRHPLSLFTIVAGGLLYCFPQIVYEMGTGLSVFLFSRVMGGKP